MKKGKRSLVLDIALSDRESFKVLPTRKEQKNIYDRIRNKLVRQGVEGDFLQTKLISEIRAELFKLQPEYKPKPEPEPETKSNFLDRKDFRVRGYDVFSEHAPEIEPIDRELEIWNKNSERYMSCHCPICKSSPCRCHE